VPFPHTGPALIAIMTYTPVEDYRISGGDGVRVNTDEHSDCYRYFLLKTDIRILRSVHLCPYDGIPMPRWDALREAWNPEVLNPSWPAVFSEKS
jgi:hypothetical protein